ncbi:MAG TPA: hypothetical protein VMG35_23270 [Bryobacteraceae bacterium]|nr:hypothetical protein [Bryobacteraceae bacterium]
MLVDVLGQPDVRVSDNLGDDLQRYALGAQERDAGVAQVVEPHRGQARRD